MGVLIRVVAVVALALAGCYQPTVSDCSLTCAEVNDCAGGQVCADGWCVAPEAAGTCGALPIDANVELDAAPTDGTPPIDSSIDAGPADAGIVQLHVVVQGRGKVVIDPLGEECVGTQSTPGDCTYPLTEGSQQTLLPVTTHPSTDFAGWTTANCSAESGACTLVIDDAVVLVGASFQ